ncbi:MAG: hypothetical protein PVSMB8_00030 [Vulcanimicrobiaceae bacterium]
MTLQVLQNDVQLATGSGTVRVRRGKVVDDATPAGAQLIVDLTAARGQFIPQTEGSTQARGAAMAALVAKGQNPQSDPGAPALAGVQLGGDLLGDGSTEANPRASAAVGAAGTYPIGASESTFNAGGPAPIISRSKKTNTLDATQKVIDSILIPDNTVGDFTVTVKGRNTANNGDMYRSDFFVTYQRFGGANPTLCGSADLEQKKKSVGGGAAYSATIAVDGPTGAVQVLVTGAGATSVDWTSALQVLE